MSSSGEMLSFGDSGTVRYPLQITSRSRRPGAPHLLVRSGSEAAGSPLSCIGELPGTHGSTQRMPLTSVSVSRALCVSMCQHRHSRRRIGTRYSGSWTVKKKLDSYKGRLTAAQIAEGMNAALKNCNRLADDAAMLLEARRYPSAMALAILAIEEAGKISILRRLAVAMSEGECADAWKEYRSHTSKSAMWVFPSLVAAGARNLEDFRPLFCPDGEHPYLRGFRA